MLLNIVTNWPVGLQFVFVAMIATAGTFISMALIGAIANFMSTGLPIILRGYCPSENDDESKDKS